METQPDLSFYFAVHQAQRDALGQYVTAVDGLSEGDRARRGKALARWAKGFACELDEHHYVEDAFFFPSLVDRVPSAAAVLDGLGSDHRRLDDLLAAWPALAQALADPAVPFEPARAAASAFGEQLRDFLGGHLDIEDADVLPLFWRHYSAADYDAVLQQAIKKGKKAGMWFVAPFSVDCIPPAERADFLASAPTVLRILHWAVRPRYDRMLAAAFERATTNVT